MTTIFGWDASHYDGDLTDDILVTAKNEGIEFFTHKLGEGTSNTDLTARQALESARRAGIRVIGGYYFIHSGDMVAQAHRCIALADQMAPWWREFPGWCWQTDAETDTGGHLRSPAEVKLFSDTLYDLTDRTVLVYASHGMYGDHLAGIGHPLWNAHYGGNPVGSPASCYAAQGGNASSGWDFYSGQTPVILQFGSRVTIAGRTTCDANAFRGTIDDLLHIINPGGATVPELTKADVADATWHTAIIPPEPDDTDQVTKDSAGSALQSARNKAIAAAQNSADNLAQSRSNGSGISEIKAILQATPPGTATITDADVERIAQRTADIVAQRMQA